MSDKFLWFFSPPSVAVILVDLPLIWNVASMDNIKLFKIEFFISMVES